MKTINGHRIDGYYQGVPYAETGSNDGGIFVTFFINDSHTIEQVEQAQLDIRRDRDVEEISIISQQMFLYYKA